ncbi:MAG: hypothetical protein KGZ71_02240 [Desulfobulbaceae bacterium]|nr:hypothetical protein [Candidatus Kapabacteria bacterium]MBS3999283.1 hypothetical protein [Desulfobulbaceae bacterium]
MKMAILVIAMLVFANQTLFEQLKEKCELSKNEYLIVIFQTPGNCVKCFIEPMDLVELIKKNSLGINYKLMALVSVEREIELKVFQKENDWKHYMLVDDGNARKDLGAKGIAMMIILDSRGKIMAEFLPNQYDKNIEKAKKFVKSR